MNWESRELYFEKRAQKLIEAHARMVAAEFDKAVQKISALSSIASIDPAKPFSFADYPSLNAIFKKEQKRLFDEIISTVTTSVKSAWGLSQQKADDLCAFVAQSTGLSGPALKAYKTLLSRNETRSQEALAAFQRRKVDGLGLSDRVWNLAGQHKQELEMALDIGIGDGKSADALSRDVRKYLQEPEKLFRRVRDKHGVLHLSKNAEAYHPGRGVYRSSYKNAIRLTGTETNIAYRSADHAAYQGLDFVVGIEIKLSGNHPVTDICDTLKGKYPKAFKWTGWHPLCRCYQVPILKTEKEFWDDMDKVLEGEKPSEESSNTVKDVPGGFVKWVGNNTDRIEAARQRGTLPYFIRDNRAILASVKVNPQITTTINTAPPAASDWTLNLQKTESKLGIIRGNEMTFEEANELKGNVNYAQGHQYKVNCQSCVVANELRRRGFDVTALPNLGIKGNIPHTLSYKTELAWIDPVTGLTPTKKLAGGAFKRTLKGLEKELAEHTKELGRYHIDFVWKGSQRSGHIITVEKLASGKWRFYDPQNGEIKAWRELSKSISLSRGVRVLRVDNLLINTDIINGVVTKS